MKIFDENRTLLTNSKNKNKLKIQANGKMFSILSDKIYKHKIAAIVREISSNCYDSHVEAGCPDKPFQVVLPTDLHPYIEFQDFGVGLSYDEVVNIFTVYGASTKNNTNDAIGAFGLGAKTPFAYSKTFSVETVKNGTSLYFNMFIDEDNEPSYSLVSEKQTDKPNGTTIKIPVSSEYDQRQFKWECEYILSFFPVRPIIVKPDYVSFDYVISEEDIQKLNETGYMVANIDKSRSDLYNSGYSAFAVMGPVCYPFNFSDANIDSWKVKEQFPVLHSLLDRNTLFIKFDIGDLDVSASRESLSLDKPQVRDILLQKLLHGDTESLKNIQDKINKCETPKELYTLVNKLYLRDFEIYKRLTYKGKKVSHIIDRKFFKGFKRRVVKTKYTKTHVIDSYGDTFSAQKLSDKKIVFLYNYGKHKTSFRNLMDYATNISRILNQSHRLVLLQNNPTEQRRESLDSILPCSSEYIDLLDIEQERKDWIKNNTEFAATAFISVNDLKPKEFKSRGIVVDTRYNETRVANKGRTCIYTVDPTDQDTIFLYIDDDDYRDGRITINVGNNEEFALKYSRLYTLFRITEPNKIVNICIRTKQSKRRMTEAGVTKSLNEYVIENWLDNEQVGNSILVGYILNNLISAQYHSNDCRELKQDVSWYVDQLRIYKSLGISGIPKLDYTDDLISILENFTDLSINNRLITHEEYYAANFDYDILTYYTRKAIERVMKSFSYNKQFDVISEIGSLSQDVLEKYLEDIDTKYPLLQMIKNLHCLSEDEKDKVKVYIGMVDSI